AGETDPFGARGRGGQEDRRRRRDIVGPMMLADAKDVEPHPVGELDLFHQVAHPLGRIKDLAGSRVRRVFNKGVDAKLHLATSLSRARLHPQDPLGRTVPFWYNNNDPRLSLFSSARLVELAGAGRGLQTRRADLARSAVRFDSATSLHFYVAPTRNGLAVDLGEVVACHRPAIDGRHASTAPDALLAGGR